MSNQRSRERSSHAVSNQGLGLKAYGFRLSYWQKFWLAVVLVYGLVPGGICFLIWRVAWVAVVVGLVCGGFIWFWGSMCGAAAEE